MAKEDVKPTDAPAAVQEVVHSTPPAAPQVKITPVPEHMRRDSSGLRDETVPGGMTVQRINQGRHFQVQNADGEPIPGFEFDPAKGAIVKS